MFITSIFNKTTQFIAGFILDLKKGRPLKAKKGTKSEKNSTPPPLPCKDLVFKKRALCFLNNF